MLSLIDRREWHPANSHFYRLPIPIQSIWPSALFHYKKGGKQSDKLEFIALVCSTNYKGYVYGACSDIFAGMCTLEVGEKEEMPGIRSTY